MNPNTAVRLALTSTIAFVLLFCAYATSKHSRCEMPATATATATTLTISDTQSTETDNKARQAARDYIKENYPTSKADGVFLLSFRTDNLYLAGVDTSTSGSSGTLRQTVDLLVRQYVRKNGQTYWRAEGLLPEEAARLRRLSLQ